MYIKTKAIVLGSLKLKENSILVKLYTQEFGRCDYILYAPHSKKNGRVSSYLQPFSIVEINADNRPNRDLQVLKDVKLLFPILDILFNPIKNVEAVFLSEILSFVLTEPAQDEPLFSFIEKSIIFFEKQKSGIANFCVAFLSQLTLFLGFYPNMESFKKDYFFDLKSASYVGIPPLHGIYLDKKESLFLQLLVRMNYANMKFFKFSREERSFTLREILEFYKIHIHGMKEPKSLSVFTEIFD